MKVSPEHDGITTRRSWAGFLLCVALGVLLAFFLLGFLAMGECLPRDDSLQMQLCDADKRSDGIRFLIVTGSLMGLACWGFYKRWAFAGMLMVFSGIIGISTAIF